MTEGDCAVGGGEDRIIFNLGGSATITLGSTLPVIIDGAGLIVDGGQNQITVSGGGNVQVLEVSSDAKLDLRNLTVANGGATFGGGIANNEGGTLNVSNSTLSGNSATFGLGFGGGIYNYSRLTTINSTTITNNTASNLGAGVASHGDVTRTSTVVDNSIIAANNGTDVDFTGRGLANTFTSEGNKLIGDGNATSAFDMEDQINVTEPGLGDLEDNGGPTKTHALLADSPAIDAGDTALSTDQRDVGRPQGLEDDIGSFELDNVAPEITVLAGSAS